MKKKEILEVLLSQHLFSLEDLVKFALDKHGFGANGYIVVTYASDLDEYAVLVEKLEIPDGSLEICFGEFEVIITESEYIEYLIDHLKKIDRDDLASQLRTI